MINITVHHHSPYEVRAMNAFKSIFSASNSSTPLTSPSYLMQDNNFNTNIRVQFGSPATNEKRQFFFGDNLDSQLEQFNETVDLNNNNTNIEQQGTKEEEGDQNQEEDSNSINLHSPATINFIINPRFISNESPVKLCRPQTMPKQQINEETETTNSKQLCPEETGKFLRELSNEFSK